MLCNERGVNLHECSIYLHFSNYNDYFFVSNCIGAEILFEVPTRGGKRGRMTLIHDTITK